MITLPLAHTVFWPEPAPQLPRKWWRHADMIAQIDCDLGDLCFVYPIDADELGFVQNLSRSNEQVLAV